MNEGLGFRVLGCMTIVFPEEDSGSIIEDSGSYCLGVFSKSLAAWPCNKILSRPYFGGRITMIAMNAEDMTHANARVAGLWYPVVGLRGVYRLYAIPHRRISAEPAPGNLNTIALKH